MSFSNSITKTRSSNLELYRIICMLMIVAHHYVVLSGLNTDDGLMKADMLSANSIYLYLFGMWGKTGINCFLMITGYFMCTSTISVRKYLKLYLWVLTYSFLINAIFILTGYEQPSPKLLLMFIPFKNIHSDSFTSAFMAWYLFIPFLNVLINNITRKQHLLLISLLILIFTVYSFIPKILHIDVNPICWFSTIYIIASYIRKYPATIYKSYSTSFWSYISVVLIMMSMMSVVTILWLSNRMHIDIPQYYMVSDSQQPLAILVAVSTFMCFKNIKLRYSKIVNILGGASFGVLLIHSNSQTMRDWLWRDTVDCLGHYTLPLPQLICYSVGAVIAIYIACSIIDYTRLRLIEEPFFKWYDKKPRFQKLTNFLTKE